MQITRARAKTNRSYLRKIAHACEKPTGLKTENLCGHAKEGQGTVVFRKARERSCSGSPGRVVFRKARGGSCSGRPENGRVQEGLGMAVFYPGRPGNNRVREAQGTAPAYEYRRPLRITVWRDNPPLRFRLSVLGY